MTGPGTAARPGTRAGQWRRAPPTWPRSRMAWASAGSRWPAGPAAARTPWPWRPCSATGSAGRPAWAESPCTRRWATPSSPGWTRRTSPSSAGRCAARHPSRPDCRNGRRTGNSRRRPGRPGCWRSSTCPRRTRRCWPGTTSRRCSGSRWPRSCARASWAGWTTTSPSCPPGASTPRPSPCPPSWYGTRDVLVPPGHGEWIARTVPGATVRLNELGHMGDPDADLHDLLGWLTSLAGAAG
jgi:hypothetical protein